MAKLKDRLLYGDPVTRPAPVEQDTDDESIDGEYGVGQRGDEVVVSLGPIPPFRLPRQSAIQLAALMLKKAGCNVAINSADCKLSASWGKLDG